MVQVRDNEQVAARVEKTGLSDWLGRAGRKKVLGTGGYQVNRVA